MYKIFLVEDEAVIRNAIKNSIDWEKEGFCFAGEAGDGELAWPLIRREKPDILITDIRMPFMDGLELSRLVRKNLPDTKIMILSGFNEFTYAQEAINLGVAEYLLKPISSAGLLEAIRKIAAQLDQEQEMAALLTRHRRETDSLEQTDQKELFEQVTEQGRIDRNSLQRFLRTGNGEQTAGFVEDFVRTLHHEAMRSMLFRQYLVMDTYFCVCDFMEELDQDRSGTETPNESEGTLRSETEAMQYMTRIIREAIDCRDEIAGSGYRDVVQEAVRYIEENYAAEDLNLNALAAHVGFSPNHLSVIFSRETGKTFIRYLTDLRMEKAKELLRCTGKKSSEIALETGYQDPHYFSYLFRKTQGMTPTQYRGMQPHA